MKKILALFLFPLILISLSSCASDSRPDCAALSERLAVINEKYAFDYFDMFLYDDTYHVYFSLCSANDALLSINIDPEGNIDDLTVTANAENFKSDNERTEFMKFASAVIDSFASLSEKEYSEMEENLSFKKPERYFTDLYEKYSSLRYNFIFSSNAEYICFYCEYYEIMETPT